MKAMVIGFGYLGKALSHRLLELDSLQCIVSKHFSIDDPHFQPFIDKVSILNSLKEVSDIPNLVFITTSDSRITNVVDEIISLSTQIEGKIFIHCSGIHSDEILNLLREKGGLIASAHPLQTFYKYHKEIFKNIYWIVQTEHFEKIKSVLERIGGTPLEVKFDDTKRSIYHSSAVVASNFLNALFLFAKKLIAKTGLNPKILVPLIQQTLENNLQDFEDVDFTPSTGPIVRADFTTIEKHLNAFLNNESFLKTYCYYTLASSFVLKDSINIDSNKLATIIQQISSFMKFNFINSE